MTKQQEKEFKEKMKRDHEILNEKDEIGVTLAELILKAQEKGVDVIKVFEDALNEHKANLKE
jgi:hypothetical protein